MISLSKKHLSVLGLNSTGNSCSRGHWLLTNTFCRDTSVAITKEPFNPERTIRVALGPQETTASFKRKSFHENRFFASTLPENSPQSHRSDYKCGNKKRTETRVSFIKE